MRRRRPGDGDDRGAPPLTAVLNQAALEEARAFNEQLAEVLRNEPPVNEIPPEVTRRARREGRSIWPAPELLPHARDLTISARGGDLRIRVLPPQDGEVAGVYLHLHGGGWVLGACDQQDARLTELAEATRLCVASVEYRLSPEHPYPAAPDDCEDAALWLLERGFDELGAPPTATIGGESAGAHLAATTLVRLRDRHGITGKFRAANLSYGVFDLSMTPSQRNWGDQFLVLSTPSMHWFGRCFTGERDGEELRDPDVSPLYAELHDLPPALFTVGAKDPLLDDSLFMAARWEAAGNDAALSVWPESVHGFNLFPLALARAANDVQYAFLRDALD